MPLFMSLTISGNVFILMSNDHLRTCFRKQVYQITLTSDIYRELTFLCSFFFLAMMRKVVWWIVDFQAKFIWMDLELMGKWMQLFNSIVMDCISFYQCSLLNIFPWNYMHVFSLNRTYSPLLQIKGIYLQPSEKTFAIMNTNAWFGC